MFLIYHTIFLLIQNHIAQLHKNKIKVSLYKIDIILAITEKKQRGNSAEVPLSAHSHPIGYLMVLSHSK